MVETAALRAIDAGANRDSIAVLQTGFIGYVRASQIRNSAFFC